jgi:hypothetical protein
MDQVLLAPLVANRPGGEAIDIPSSSSPDTPENILSEIIGLAFGFSPCLPFLSLLEGGVIER